jgi:hypothetical protein
MEPPKQTKSGIYGRWLYPIGVPGNIGDKLFYQLFNSYIKPDNTPIFEGYVNVYKANQSIILDNVFETCITGIF